jgi:hypothetical protein
MPEKIDPKQVRLIHVAKSKLNIDDATYRSMLKTHFPGHDWEKPDSPSSLDLNFDEADRLLLYFKRLGFEVKPVNKCRAMCGPRKRREKLPDNVVLFISPGQRREIERLKADITWKVWDGFDRWLKKYFKMENGMKSVKYSPEASAIIEGLKNLWKSQNGCACKLAGGKR